MPRAASGVPGKARHKKVLKQAKGYRGAQSKLYRTALERVRRALRFAYRDRRAKKRDMRSLWIVRIGVAARESGLNYAQFIHGLKLADVSLNRKVLADLAVSAPNAFAQVAEAAKGALSKAGKPLKVAPSVHA